MDSGCDLSSGGIDSPSSYRRLQQDDNSTSSFSPCSSCDATVDQSSNVYKQLAQTLAQVRHNTGKDCHHLPGSESFVGLLSANNDDDGGVELEKTEENEQIVSCGDDEIKEKSNDPPSSSPLIPHQMLSPETKSRKSRGRLLPQVLASLALAIAALIEGYSSGYTSPALASMTHSDSEIPVNAQQV